MTDTRDHTEKLADLLNEHELMVCTKDWSAWGHGTMSAGDFINAGDDPDLVNELAERLAQPATVSREQLKDACRYHYAEEGEGDYDRQNDWTRYQWEAALAHTFHAAGIRIKGGDE